MNLLRDKDKQETIFHFNELVEMCSHVANGELINEENNESKKQHKI